MADDNYWGEALARMMNTPSPAWQALTSRVRITQEQIEDSRNSQGAFVRAAEQERQRMAEDWQRSLERYLGMRNDTWPFGTWEGDPDLELDEGL